MPLAALTTTEPFERSERSERLERLERLERPERPERFERFERYLTWNPSRGSNFFPSPRTASTQIAAGVPSFIGRPVIVTFVPAGNALGRIPARCSVLGPSASKPHVVTLPFLSFTSTSSHECGFEVLKFFDHALDGDLLRLLEHRCGMVG